MGAYCQQRQEAQKKTQQSELHPQDLEASFVFLTMGPYCTHTLKLVCTQGMHGYVYRELLSNYKTEPASLVLHHHGRAFAI